VPLIPARLITIPISHYCEEARWALDRATSATCSPSVPRPGRRRGRRPADVRCVAARLEDGRRYLCGDAFTAADLAFAALAAPVIVPPEYGTPLPAPDELPAEMAAGVRAFRAHPAGAFASRLFREER
jgi:glutathione S-transferase